MPARARRQTRDQREVGQGLNREFGVGPSYGRQARANWTAGQTVQSAGYQCFWSNFFRVSDRTGKCHLDVPFVHRLKAVQAIAGRLFDGHLPG